MLLLKMALCIVPVRLVMPYNDVLMPTIQIWSRKLRLSEYNVVLRICIFSSLAAVLSPIGGPTNIILMLPDHRLGFFSGPLQVSQFLPVGCLVFVCGLVYMIGFMEICPDLEFPLSSSCFTPRSRSRMDNKSYMITLQCTDRFAFLHQTVEDSGIANVPGVHIHRVYTIGAHPNFGHNHPYPFDDHKMGDRFTVELREGEAAVVPPILAPQQEDDLHAVEAGYNDFFSWVLAEGDWLTIECTAEAVTKLRMMEGLELDPRIRSNVEFLGSKRKRRHLMEAVLSPRSEMIGGEFPKGVTRFTMAQKVAFLALRRPTDGSGSEGGVEKVDRTITNTRRTTHNRTTPRGGTYVKQQDDATWSRVHHGCDHGGPVTSGTFQAGDILLLEAFQDFQHSKECGDNFELIVKVPGSRAPRFGTAMDRFRHILSLICMASLFIASYLPVQLAFQVLFWTTVLFATKVISVDATIRQFPFSHLVEIVFSFGAAVAIQNSGLSNQFAQLLCVLEFPNIILAFLYLLSSSMCVVVSNVTACILLMPVVSELSILSKIRLENCIIVLLFSTHFSFITSMCFRNNFTCWKELESIGVQSSRQLMRKEVLRLMAPLQMTLMLATILSINAVHPLTYAL